MAEETEDNKLLKRIMAAAEALLPPGAALSVNGTGMRLEWWLLEVVCDGAISDMAYTCTRRPDHDGKCWNPNKNVDFTPETGGPHAQNN